MSPAALIFHLGLSSDSDFNSVLQRSRFRAQSSWFLLFPITPELRLAWVPGDDLHWLSVHPLGQHSGLPSPCIALQQRQTGLGMSGTANSQGGFGKLTAPQGLPKVICPNRPRPPGPHWSLGSVRTFRRLINPFKIQFHQWSLQNRTKIKEVDFLGDLELLQCSNSSWLAPGTSLLSHKAILHPHTHSQRGSLNWNNYQMISLVVISDSGDYRTGKLNSQTIFLLAEKAKHIIDLSELQNWSRPGPKKDLSRQALRG